MILFCISITEIREVMWKVDIRFKFLLLDFPYEMSV